MTGDVIANINKQYFSSEKDEVNIMADLGECIQRLITVITVEELLKIANAGYEPNRENKKTFINHGGKKAEQITITYIDKYNFATLRNIHGSLMDALALSLRNLFYCKKDSNAAGAFVMKIAKLPNLQELNKNHLPRVNVFCFHKKVHFITTNDFQEGFVMLNGSNIPLKDRPQEKYFVINPGEEYVAVHDPDSQKAHVLAKTFYENNYKEKNATNLGDIKIYEQFHFHKDRWPDNKRFNITTTTKYVYGLKTNCHHYDDLCKINFPKIIECLEDISEIINLYYRSCVSGYMNCNMNIWCNAYCSLDKMVSDTIGLFNIQVPTEFYSKTVENIKQRIPRSLSVMMLR